MVGVGGWGWGGGVKTWMMNGVESGRKVAEIDLSRDTGDPSLPAAFVPPPLRQEHRRL